MTPHLAHAKTIFAYYALHAVATAVILGGVVVCALNSVSLTSPPTVQYNTYQCVAGGEAKTVSFRVLLYTEQQAIRHADALCRDPLIRQGYRNVHVTWRHRDLKELRIIFDQQFDLLLTKPEMIERSDVDLIDRYVPIALYNDNTSRFISLESPPKLSIAYLREKKLGLLDSPTSVSGHRVPRQAIRNAGIDEGLLTIRHYETHEDLYAALLHGEVDLIATGLALPTEDRSKPHHYILPIREGLKSPRWYLRPTLVDTALHCHVASILRELSVHSTLAYEQGIEIVRGCR